MTADEVLRYGGTYCDREKKVFGCNCLEAGGSFLPRPVRYSVLGRNSSISLIIRTTFNLTLDLKFITSLNRNKLRVDLLMQALMLISINHLYEGRMCSL